MISAHIWLVKVLICLHIYHQHWQKYKSAQMYREWWYKCTKVHKCTAGSGGTNAKVYKVCTTVQVVVLVVWISKMPLPSHYVAAPMITEAFARLHHHIHHHHHQHHIHHHRHNHGICQELVALNNQAKSYLTPNPNIEVMPGISGGPGGCCCQVVGTGFLSVWDLFARPDLAIPNTNTNTNTNKYVKIGRCWQVLALCGNSKLICPPRSNNSTSASVFTEHWG